MIRLNEDHRQIREVVASFSDKELWPRSAAIDKDQVFPRAGFAELAELGVLGIPVPGEHGGADGDLLMLMLVLEELGRGCAATGMVVASHAGAALALKQLGTPAQCAEFLPDLASGETIGTLAVPGDEFDDDFPVSATRDSGGWVLQGTKRFVVGGGEAGLYVLVARMVGPSDAGPCVFVVEGGASAPGVRVTKVEDMLGLRGGRFAEVAFDGCRLPATALLGGAGTTLGSLQSVIGSGRVAAAAIATGIARRGIDYARKYASERRAFGKTIDRFEAIRNMFADAHTSTEAGSLLTYRAACLADQGQNFEAEASMAKLHCTAATYQTTKACVQILGGNGFSREYPVERLYRDAESLEVLESQASIHRRLIASRLLEAVS